MDNDGRCECSITDMPCPVHAEFCGQCGADVAGDKRDRYTGESLAHDKDCPWYGNPESA